MGLLFRLFFILQFFNCSSSIKKLLPKKEIKIESNYKYVVADGEDKVSIEIIEETLDKGIGSKRKIDNFKIKVHSLIDRSNKSLDSSIIIEGKNIKFKTPGDYSIMAICYGKETREPAIVKARRDLKNVYHISKHDNFNLAFKDEESNEIISDVKFQDMNGKSIAQDDLEELFRNQDRLELKAFLHGSELGTLIIYLYDLKLESINNLMIKGEENQLKISVTKKNDKRDYTIINDYKLIYKKGKEEKTVEVNNSNLLDFEKLVSDKLNRYVESYEICVLARLEVDGKKYEIRTNSIEIFVLNKWEEVKTLLAFQPFNLKNYKNYYKDIEIKAFSRYEDEQQKELDINSYFQEQRIGFSEISFELNGKRVGKIKIKSLGNINIKENNESVIFKNNNQKILAYLDRNNLKNFHYSILGDKEKEIDNNSFIEWRFYINENEYEVLKSFSEIEHLNLNNLEDYEFKFVYISSYNSESFESLPIIINLFEKPENQILHKTLRGASKAELIGLEQYLEHLNICDNYSMDKKEFVDNEKISSSLKYFKSNNFLIYKFENRIYITPLKAFDFSDEIKIKIGNTNFCQIKSEVQSKLVEEIEIENWLGINNKGNTCFANGAFKFLSSLKLVDYYVNNNIEEKLIVLGKEQHVNAIQYLKAIINGIRLGKNGSFASKEVAAIFIKNFLKLDIIQVKETKLNIDNGELEDKLSENFGDGGQHDAVELVNRILKILASEKSEIDENEPSFISMLVRTSKFNGDRASTPKINFDNCTNLTLDLKGHSSQEALNIYFNSEQINWFYNLYKNSSEKIRFKVGNGKSRSINAKDIKDLKEKLKSQEFLIIYSSKEAQAIEAKENELLSVLENKEKIEDKKRYKIIFENGKEYFILVQKSTHTSTISLFMGIDNVEAQREVFIEKCNKILYLNFKRLIKNKEGNIIKIFSNTKMDEEIQLKTYNKNKTKMKRYRLVGAIIHEGNAESGHYYAYIKGKSGWTKQNDSSASKIDFLPEGAYCSLAYELID